jgi:hypothetical protein
MDKVQNPSNSDSPVVFSRVSATSPVQYPLNSVTSSQTDRIFGVFLTSLQAIDVAYRLALAARYFGVNPALLSLYLLAVMPRNLSSKK